MKQTSLRSNAPANRSNANETGRSGKQLAAPLSHVQPLQAAADKKKKPASMKEDAQLAADKKKKPASMKEDAQLAADKKKKPASMKEDAQLAADKKKKPAAMKLDSGITIQNKMPEHVQQKMESTMNADFSDVNIHVGSKASSVGALAYAQGNDIHFAQGKFNPNTSDGQSLLGHELAHVVQQRQGRVKATTSVNGLPVNDDRSLEKEADAMGAKAAAAKA
ncbi:MAG: DUF4157 domain-containing protein [Bacteroidota bacterium]|nr:DUF4157 domain-containing protein [Bacteroidota bacterium]